MKKILLTLFLLPIALFAQDEKVSKSKFFKGYTGGMQVHAGYIRGDVFSVNNGAYTQQVKGMATGIGGKMSFYANDYFRWGGEGYATKTTYGPHKSLQQITWGGLLLEGVYPVDKFGFFAGATFGGGSVMNTVLVEDPGLSFETKPTLIRKYPLILANPFIGVEYALSSKIQLILKADYMLNMNKIEPDFGTGVRVYFGFMFQHKK